ncbi:MAG: ATP-dependent DNA helicase [Fimbriimonadales bacterium]
MSGLWQTVEAAFQRLESQHGFSQRPLQRRMAQFVCEQLEFGRSVMVEAPTGVGKSLALLLPAIAYALQHDKRVVISTYTVLLAEQYWRKDLPLALELFPNKPSVALAMGRSRYACKDIICDNEQGNLFEDSADLLRRWVNTAQEGTESELSEFLRQRGMHARQIQNLWTHAAVPSACRAHLCEKYRECFYYQVRERARQARIVVTTHAFVLTDAIVRQVTNDKASLLDTYDYLIFDEAHDLLAATASALEFDLDQRLIGYLTAHAWTLFRQMKQLFKNDGKPPKEFTDDVEELVSRFTNRVRKAYSEMVFPNTVPPEGVATRVAPESLARMRAMRGAYCPDLHPQVVRAATAIREAIHDFDRDLDRVLHTYEDALTASLRNKIAELLEEFQPQFSATQVNLERLKDPPEIGVSWVEWDESSWKACYEPIVLADWLRTHLWRRCPAMLVSATLAVDGQFDFFAGQLGFEPHLVLQLPPVFDYGRQCALYMPPRGAIPNPPQNAASPQAEAYYQRLAEEIATLIRLTQGRALVLFSSVQEMRRVRQRVQLDGIPILMQGEGSVADLARRFLEDVHAVLFGVRSFWTGFDAPGETLVNLILARIPFEVPTTPLQRARQAWFEAQGLDTFLVWTLPIVKLQMRQGVGRLMRGPDDWGIVAILDPRMRTKPYGAEILRNLPAGMPIFDTHAELANWLRSRQI